MSRVNDVNWDGRGIPAGCNRVFAGIDLDAVRFNMENMHKNLRAGTKMIGVLKTDAYGHGALGIMRELEKLPYVWGYAVASFEEAAELREGGTDRPILILGYSFPYAYEQMGPMGIRPAVFREDMLTQLSQAAERSGSDIFVHIAVDTGMGRIGVTPDEEGAAFVEKALHTPHLVVEGVFTHFARADECDLAPAKVQLRRYNDFVKLVRERTGFTFPLRHASNSAGIIRFPEANADLVRAGITLYGLWPSEEVEKDIVAIRPVMSLHSSIAFIKEAGPGLSVSYGGTFTTSADMTRIATIPVGYGDGYPRSLSGKGEVLIRGQRAPILGRVCMDQMMVDVTHIPEAAEGDLVTLIGRDGGSEITMEELGALSGRFNYELACDINQRVPRVLYRSE